jgi:DCN1-like protein 1/2
MGAEYMCEFKKPEFISGMTKMGCDSLDKLRKRLPELRAELKQAERLRDVYNYAYMFSREVGEGVCVEGKGGGGLCRAGAGRRCAAAPSPFALTEAPGRWVFQRVVTAQ